MEHKNEGHAQPFCRSIGALLVCIILTGWLAQRGRIDILKVPPRKELPVEHSCWLFEFSV